MPKITSPSGQETEKASCKRLILMATALLLISGCAAQGAKPVPRGRIAIQRLGAAENMSFGEIPASGYSDSKEQVDSDFKQLKCFERMINLIFILSDNEVIEVQLVEEDDKSERYLIITEEVAENLRPSLDELRQLIGLSNRNRFRITDRVTKLKDDEISIQTRSVMAMMEFMARGVEVSLLTLLTG